MARRWEFARRGLTKPVKAAILYVSGLLRSLRGAALAGVHARRKPLFRFGTGAFCFAASLAKSASHAPPAPHLITIVRPQNATKHLYFVAFAAGLKNRRAKRGEHSNPSPHGSKSGNKIPVLFRSASRRTSFRQNLSISARGCQAFFRPGAPRRNLPRAVKRWSAIA